MRLTTMTCAALLMAASGYAQDEAARRAATEVAARVPLERAIKGVPYSAETIVEGSQQLADGNRINRKTTGRVYRDSEGRTRREDDRPNGVVAISITDPVAGFSYSLDAQNKVAWRTPMGNATAIMGKVDGSQPAVGFVRQVEPVRTPGPDGTTTVSNRVTFVETTRAEMEKIEAARVAERRMGAEDAPSTAVARGGGGGVAAVAPAEAPRARGGGGRGGAVAPTNAGPLEHKVIDGQPVEGRKTTTVIPAGQVGNEQPITITSEQWRSPDLNVLVMTRHSDPRSGDSVYRLQNIIRAEPDRSLFMVPADYTVRDTGVRRMVEGKMLEGKMLEASQRK